MSAPEQEISGPGPGSAESGADSRRWRAGRWRERGQFLWAFLRSPARVGAICPSSARLARAMVAGSRLDQARLVVELGPGTGSFTRVILQSLGPQTRFFALELDDQAVRGLRERFPGLEVFHDSAEAVGRRVAESGHSHADYVVSGLPWAVMPEEIQKGIMRNVVGALAPGGVFTTFAYLHSRPAPPARRYRRLLDELFHSVHVSPVVWRNLPPALVYRCVK